MKVLTAQRDLLPWVGLAVLLGAASAMEPRLSLLAVASLLVILVWRWPDASLQVAAVGILAIRPALDIFSSSRDPTATLAVKPSSALGMAVMITAAVIGLLRLLAHRPVWPDAGLRRAHYWLFAANAIGLCAGFLFFGSSGLVVGLREALRVASTIAALLLVLWWLEGRPERYRVGWALLLAGTALPIFAAIVQWATDTGYHETEGYNRLQGTFSHPTSLGPYLVPFILYAVGGVVGANMRGRLLRIGLIALMTTIMLLTYSRTSLLVLLAGLALLPFLYARRLGFRAVVRGGVMILAVTAVGWLLAGGLIQRRFADITLDRTVVESALQGQSENSFTWRILNWGILTRMGMEHPMIGHGIGMTTVLNPLVNHDYGDKPFNAHDDYVRFFFETGILGLVCYIVFGVLLCAWALRRARAADRSAASESYAVAASWVALLFLSVGTPELSSQTAILFTLYGMLALLTAVPLDMSRAGVARRDAS